MSTLPSPWMSTNLTSWLHCACLSGANSDACVNPLRVPNDISQFCLSLRQSVRSIVGAPSPSTPQIAVGTHKVEMLHVTRSLIPSPLRSATCCCARSYDDLTSICVVTVWPLVPVHWPSSYDDDSA